MKTTWRTLWQQQRHRRLPRRGRGRPDRRRAHRARLLRLPRPRRHARRHRAERGRAGGRRAASPLFEPQHRLRRPRQLRAPGVLAGAPLRLLGRRRRRAAALAAAPRRLARRSRRAARFAASTAPSSPAASRAGRSKGRRPGKTARHASSSAAGRSDSPRAGRPPPEGARTGSERYSNRPSRIHLVATHFSPATTGAPPCSDCVDGCGRS